ncbi:hypothetical protein [Micromonospora sp. NPDC005254]|uniref:hypothetical protein n=1 Tax=Micromonospora sp. NPDC005254 TaxID=3364229 RepID=UPI00367D8E53
MPRRNSRPRRVRRTAVPDVIAEATARAHRAYLRNNWPDLAAELPAPRRYRDDAPRRPEQPPATPPDGRPVVYRAVPQPRTAQPPAAPAQPEQDHAEILADLSARLDALAATVGRDQLRAFLVAQAAATPEDVRWSRLLAILDGRPVAARLSGLSRAVRRAGRLLTARDA